MKSIILKSHEVIHLRDTGSVIAWRVVKPQPNRDSKLNRMQDGYKDGCVRAVFEEDDEPNAYGIKCPYGRTGEERWVKETFVDGYPSDCGELQMFDENGNELPRHVWYRADENLVSQHGAPMEEWLDDDGAPLENIPWRPSTHMPRWASRFTVTLDVGLNRIQEVTEEEAMASVKCSEFTGKPYCTNCSGHELMCNRTELINTLAAHDGDFNSSSYFWKITCTLKK